MAVYLVRHAEETALDHVVPVDEYAPDGQGQQPGQDQGELDADAAAIADAAGHCDQIIFAGHTHPYAEAVAEGLAAPRSCLSEARFGIVFGALSTPENRRLTCQLR